MTSKVKNGPKTRIVESLARNGDGVDVKFVGGESATGVPFSSFTTFFKRTELMALVKALGGVANISLTNGEMAAIIRGLVMNGATISSDSPTPSPIPSPSPSPMPSPSPSPSPSPQPVGGIDAVVMELMRNMLGEWTPAASVDEGKVREIVADAVKNIVPTVVHVPQRVEPFRVDGVQHSTFATIVALLNTIGASGGRGVFLYGPAGSGKTYTARLAAEAAGFDVVDVLAATPDLSPSALRGFIDANGNYRRTTFRDAYEHGGVFIIDEIDNMPPAVSVGVANTAMTSDMMAFPDGVVKRHEAFRVVACANTCGTGPTSAYMGRFPIDASTIDRFDRLFFGYERAVERVMVARFLADDHAIEALLDAVETIRANGEAMGLAATVTPRGSQRAAELLAIGMAWDTVLDVALLPSGSAQSPDQRRRLLENVKPVKVNN